MSREDPKHGRWILPIVIFVLVGFTYVFVNSLPPGDIPDAAADNGTDDGTTTTTGAVQTTTTLSPELVTFLDGIDEYETTAQQLAIDARTINDGWDARTTGLSVIRAELARIETDAAALSAAAASETPPEALSVSWAIVIDTTNELTVAASAMITGLESADDGTLRRTALTEFEEAALSVEAAVDDVRSAAETA